MTNVGLPVPLRLEKEKPKNEENDSEGEIGSIIHHRVKWQKRQNKNEQTPFFAWSSWTYEKAIVADLDAPGLGNGLVERKARLRQQKVFSFFGKRRNANFNCTRTT